MKNKQTHDYLREIQESIFSYDYNILLIDMKFRLPKCKKPKKVESPPKKELTGHMRMLSQFFQQHSNYSYMKEAHALMTISFSNKCSDIEKIIWRGLSHLQLLKLLTIKKAFSNLSFSCILVCYKIFLFINKSFWEVISN